MSDKSMEVFISDLAMEPEGEFDENQLEINFEKASFDSSVIEVMESIGTIDFKYVWLTSKKDILKHDVQVQRIFVEQMLDKIYEVYDFSFPYKITLDTQNEINEFYLYLEFLEYNNANFLIYVWTFLGPKSLIKINIENYCKENTDKILKEIREQLENHPQSKLINLFLRSCYKEKFIEWFIKNTQENIIEITVAISL